MQARSSQSSTGAGHKHIIAYQTRQKRDGANVRWALKQCSICTLTCCKLELRHSIPGPCTQAWNSGSSRDPPVRHGHYLAEANFKRQDFFSSQNKPSPWVKAGSCATPPMLLLMAQLVNHETSTPALYKATPGLICQIARGLIPPSTMHCQRPGK